MQVFVLIARAWEDSYVVGVYASQADAVVAADVLRSNYDQTDSDALDFANDYRFFVEERELGGAPCVAKFGQVAQV